MAQTPRENPPTLKLKREYSMFVNFVIKMHEEIDLIYTSPRGQITHEMVAVINASTET
jgi:hypothetical protein